MNSHEIPMNSHENPVETPSPSQPKNEAGHGLGAGHGDRHAGDDLDGTKV